MRNVCSGTHLDVTLIEQDVTSSGNEMSSKPKVKQGPQRCVAWTTRRTCPIS